MHRFDPVLLLGLLGLLFSSSALAQTTYARIGTPTEGSIVALGETLRVYATARDPEGIEAARLWINDQYHSIDTTAPYEFSVAGLTAGTHRLMVRVKDRRGNTVDSPAVSITVARPFSTITSPAAGARFTVGQTVTVQADAADPDGIAAARLWINGQFHSLSSSEDSPYAFTVSGLTAGTHTLLVRTRDRLDNSLDSAPVSITVNPASQPSYARITTPAANASYTLGQRVSVSAEAFASVGISGARLWINGEFHSLDETAPYAFTIDDLPVGSHSLMVRARDTQGTLIDSSTRSITVNRAASAAITAPAANTVVELGQTLTVRAEAYDPDGIEAARLWINGVYHSLDNTDPYSFTVNALPVGTHSLLVRTKDVLGNLLDSPAVTITVRAPTQPPVAAITAPLANAQFTVGQTVAVQANASDPDGIAEATLLLNGAVHSSDTSAPYSFSVSGLAVGTHTLTLRTRDGRGNLLSSAPVPISVRAAPTPAAAALPVEVLGPAGTSKQLTVNLSDTSGITHLYLRCNACGYHHLADDKNAGKVKATVSVNGGAAIPLKHFIEGSRVYGNNNIRIVGDGEEDYGGLGGGFRTVRLTVPVSGLRIGNNTFTFTHRDADLQSLGFRIVDFNLLRGDNPANRVLSGAQIALDNPTQWTAPRSAPADISAGRALWSQRDALYDPWVDSLDNQMNGGAVTGRLRAACADCHAADGRDLKYFNYSNESIIARSVFHRLSRVQGEQIASYLRSLPQRVVAQARPWNPAYQPGAGLDARPAYEWAAGAGIDAVLNNDRDLQGRLFPNGTAQAEVDRVVDRYATLNFRQLPVNIPMPEWSQWLPVIHPDDAFRSDFYSVFYDRAADNPTPATLGGLSEGLKRTISRDVTCLVNGPGSSDAWRGLNGVAFGNLRLPSTAVTNSNCGSVDRDRLQNIEHAKRGLTAWASVKLWELVHANNLEEASRGMNRQVCSAGRCINASEARGWVAEGRNIFDRPPHFTGVAGSRNYFHQNEMLGIFESNAWYHLQMVLNHGYRQTMPAHFAYTYSHVELLQQYSGVPQGFRFWATMIKQRQLQTNGRYGIEAGLDLRTAQPYVYYGTARGRTSTATQSSVGQPLWGRLAQSMVDDFVEDANNATAEDWARANQNRAVQPRNSPARDFTPCSGTCVFELGEYQGTNTYRVIPKLRDIGVAPASVDRLISWGKKTWPNANWDSLR